MGKLPTKDREEVFVDEYLIHLNATRAYKKAHPDATDQTCRTEGSRWLAKPNIQEKISKAKAERSKRTHVTQDKVVTELARVAFSDLRDFADWPSQSGTSIVIKPSFSLKTKEARALSEVSNTANGLKIKLHNKVRALEVLLEHVARENEKAADSQPLNFVELIKKAAAGK